MIATPLLIVAATIWLSATTGSLVASTVTRTEIDCENGTSLHYAEAAYRVWRSVSIRSPYFGQCCLNLTLETLSVRRQPDLPPLHLLVKVMLPPLHVRELDVYVRTSQVTERLRSYRSSNYGNSNKADYYIWSGESVWLIVNIFAGFRYREPLYVEAAFVATEVTNVCNSSRTGELLVISSSSGNSSEYVFAPDVRNVLLSPNKTLACSPDSEYSLTMHPRVASSFLAVTVVVCPLKDSCSILLLNGLSCREGETLQAPQQPGWSVTLHYVLRSNCSQDYAKFTGFLVSAQVSDSIVQAHGEQQVLDSGTCVIATAIVGTFSATAFAIGLIVALRARRQLGRALSRQPPQTGLLIGSAVSATRGGQSETSDAVYEPLAAAASDQHVYERTVPSSV